MEIILCQFIESCMYYSLFNPSLLYGHLGCFQYFAITNTAAMNNNLMHFVVVVVVVVVVLEVYLQSKFLEVGQRPNMLVCQILSKGFHHCVRLPVSP